MAKHKQSKRERKFNAKGGVKARLEKGHTIAPKGKVLKRKRRGNNGNALGAEEQQNNKRKKEDNNMTYSQQQEAQRESENFVGSANLGDMDIGSFLANLEEDLKQDNDSEEEDSIVSMDDNDDDNGDDDEDDGSSSEEEEEEEKAKASSSATNSQKKMSSNPKTNKTNKGDSDSDDSSDSSSDSDSDDDEKPKKSVTATTKKETLKTKTKDAKQQKETKKKKDDDSSDDDDNESSDGSDDSDSDDEDIEAVEARMKAQMEKLQSQDPEFHEYLQENEQSLLEFGKNEEDDNDGSDDDDHDDDHDNDSSDDSDSEGEDKKKRTSKKKDKKKKQSKDNEDDEKTKKEQESEDGRSIELTHKMLRNLEHGAFQAHGIKSLKKLVRAYKAACQVAADAAGEDEEEDDETEGGNGSKRRRQLQEKIFRIESSEVFDRLMVSCLGQCHEAFYFHLLATEDEREAKIQHQQQQSNTSTKKSQNHKKAGADEDEDTKTSKKKKKKKAKSKSKEQEQDDDDDGGDDKKDKSEEEDSDDIPLDPKILERSPRWMEMKPILNTFLKATQQLITESKDPDLLAIVLKSMSKYIRYLTPFPKMAESLLRKLVGLWSAPLGDASPDYQVVRLNSFLRIRQLALTQPFPFVELCLKKTYLAYARRAKYGGTGSVMTNALPTLTFMGNCIVELYSLDHQSSYQHAFVYIRQLALYLRTVMQKKTTESMQQVYCWQFMHCLKLWVAVLSAACKQARDVGDNNSNRDDQLIRSLVYPLTEIIMGTVRMAPAPTRHVPLRFHCIRLLQQLAASAEMFIPTTSLLLEILDLKEFTTKPKKIKAKGGGATTRGVQLPFLIKLSKDDPLRTAEEQEACMAEVFKLLNREVDLYRFSAGFPEYSMQITQRLKKFVKTTKNSRWRAYARGSIDLCKRYTDFVVNARSKLSEAPKDVKQLECLRQAKDPTMTERYDVAVEKENKEWTSLIAASTAASTMEKKKKKKASANNEKEVDSESDEEDDEAEEEEEEIVKKPPKRKAAKGKKAKQPLKPPPTKVDDVVMEIADTVKEGVDWSDDED